MNSATVKIILAVSTPDQDEEISLVGHEFIFGRSPNSTVVLNDPNFSRTHFKIYVHERKLWIADAGSSNGTYVNGERLGPQSPVELEAGESITVPNSKIELSLVETNYQAGAESTNIIELPNLDQDDEENSEESSEGFYEEEPDESEEEMDDEPAYIEMPRRNEKFSSLSDKIYEAANLKIEQIIHDATVKASDMIEATELEIERKKAQAFEESDNLIAEKQRQADLDIEKFKEESKIIIQKEFEEEKQSQIENLKNGIASDRKILLKKLEDEANAVQKENERKKQEFIQALNKLEALLATKKEEYVNLDIVFEEKLEKATEELNQKLNAKKKDLEKLEKNYQEEKEKLVIQVEKETENRRAELQEVINEYKEKIRLKHKELEQFEIEVQGKKEKTLERLAQFETEIQAKQEKIVEQLEMDTQLKKEELLLVLSEVENKILAKKNEIHKLELAHESQKNNQFKILEAQVESRKIELETELTEKEEKIEAAQKEFAALFDQYEKKKGEQAQALEALKKERADLQKEIKDLEIQLAKDKKLTADEIEANKNLVAGYKSDTEKLKRTKIDAELAFQKTSQEYAELQKNVSEIKKLIQSEEIQLKQKKQTLQSVEAETKKMFVQKDEILPKITALNAEYSELSKKVQAANHVVANLDSDHAKKIEALKTDFLQKKTALDEEVRKLKEAEEKRVQNLTSQEMARINKIKEDSLRMVLELEDSITKELSNSTSKVFANTIGMEKFREIAPDYDKSIRTSLQAGVLKLLTNELSTPNPNKAAKTLSSKQKNWKPMFASALVSAIIFGLIPHFYRQMKDLNDPVRKRMEEEARIAAIVPPKKFTPDKVSTLGSTFVNSVIYTEGFCDVYAQEDFRSELMKKGSVYLYKQWQIDEEKSIQSYAMIFSMIDLLKEKASKIDPDFEKRDIGKMDAIEKDTMKKLEKILGNEVRLEAALKFQTRFYQDYVARGPGASTTPDP